MSDKMPTYVLIGFPLGHSFSKKFFSEKFKKEKIHAEYINIELAKMDSFPDLLKQYPNLKGINITIPHKENILPYLDRLSPAAAEIGAVNCVVFQDGKLIGHNTDYFGFRESLKPLLSAAHKQALVLGTGGSSKAVLFALKQLGISARLVSRKPSATQLSYADLDQKLFEENLLIINTSPVGMSPEMDAAPQIPYHFLGPKHLLYDLIYNPAETQFLKKGKVQAAKVKNGLEMLELQALRSWEHWNEKP